MNVDTVTKKRLKRKEKERRDRGKETGNWGLEKQRGGLGIGNW